MAVLESAYNSLGDIILSHIEEQVQQSGLDLRIKRYINTSRQIRVFGSRQALKKMFERGHYLTFCFKEQAKIDQFEDWLEQNPEVQVLHQIKGLGWLEIVVFLSWQKRVELAESNSWNPPSEEERFYEFGIVEFRESE